jgi:hypothetical protein
LSGALGLVAAGIGVSIVPGAAVLMRGQDVYYAPVDEEGAICPVVLSSVKGNHLDIVASILAETQRLRELDAADRADDDRRPHPIVADHRHDNL